MDTKKFTTVLRKIIREEVTKAVRREMRHALNEQKTNQKIFIYWNCCTSLFVFVCE